MVGVVSDKFFFILVLSNTGKVQYDCKGIVYFAFFFVFNTFVYFFTYLCLNQS